MLGLDATYHSNETSTNSSDTWADAARREYEVFAVGTAKGIWQNGVGTYEKEPWKLIRDAGTLGALQFAMRAPGLTRIPIMAAGVLGGLSILGEAVPVGVDAVSKFRQTAEDPSSEETNKQWAETALGPLSLELSTFAFAGKAAQLGGRFLSGLELRPSFGTRLGAGTADGVMPPIDARIIQPRKPAANGSEAENIKALLAEQTDYSMVGKMERGTRGAYLVKDRDGVQHIFKLVSTDDLTPQITRSAQAAAAVNSLGARTPTYEEVRFTPGYGSWYVQELLDGKPAPYPSDKLIDQMVTLNDRQANAAVAGTENWNEKVMQALHNDSRGWQRSIAGSGAEGAELVRRVQSFVGKSGSFVPRTTDIVHGDFQHYNALASPSDRLTGYVDWEGAGHGDRSIDLSRLLYDAYVSEAEIGYRANPHTLNMLSDKISSISGPAALNSYMGYWILQVADYGTKVGPEASSMFMGVGRRIMDDLGSKPQAPAKQAVA